MRIMSYWPETNLQYCMVRRPDTSMPELKRTRLPEHESRPVFWILAYPDEAREHILPHMVNEAILYLQVSRLLGKPAGGLWAHPSGELAFFTPAHLRLTDPPVICPYWYLARGPRPRLESGPCLSGDSLREGIVLPDISCRTLLAVTALLRSRDAQLARNHL